MDKILKYYAYMFPFIAGAIGLIVFSSAMSSEKWNAFKSPGQNHDDLAWLVALCGLSIFLLLPILFGLVSKIRKLEKLPSAHRPKN